MIYRHSGDKIQTLGRQSVFNFNLYLCGETPILRKSLLVFYYYYKEKKVLVGGKLKKNEQKLKN